MDESAWRIVVLIGLIVAALALFRPTQGGGNAVCPHCGFSAAPGTPACPRCGQHLDTTTIELERLEQARRRGEIGETEYRHRKIALIQGRDRDDGT